jgi:cardiolipin synthase (CMP-forming)
VCLRHHRLFGFALSINLPNFITLGRVFSVPFVFWLLWTGQAKAAFFLFVAAGISDAVDGFLAKRYQMQTELGAYLDPLADKLLIVSIYIALGAQGQLPLWLVIAVVSRDLAILAGFLLTWMMNHPAEVKPVLISKLNTLAQIVLAAVVLADEGFGIGLETVRWALAWITGVLTVASLVSYSRTWFTHMTQPGAASVDGKVR